MERFVYTLIGILALALLATGLTQATLAMGRNRTADDSALSTPAPKPSPSPTVSAAPAAAVTLSPTPTPTPAATPATTPVARTAKVVSYVRMRQGPSTATAILAELQAGYVVTLGAYSDAQWQEATYNGVHGYIYKAYLSY